ncbi:MAG: chromosomal replication initiator protein DnaA [Phycisphaerales bacterium]
MAILKPGNGVTARICQDLADRLGPTRYGLWFDQSAMIGVDDEGTVHVTVPSRFHADWISRNFRNDLCEVATTAVGKPVDLAVEIKPDAFGDPRAERPTSNGKTTAHAPAPDRRRPRARRPSGGARFDPRFDLDRFVVGDSNRFPYHAACRVADGEETYSPLFLHGVCGVGKTHLLQGVCRRFLARRPGARVRYYTGEQFTNQYIHAVRTNRIEEFRQSIRELDLLAVDDVHFLSNKNATQNEFLCTFDAIEMTGARIVLASDEHPRRIEQFHARLISRFMSGMVIEVALPDRDTRRRIVTRIAEARGLRFNEAASEALSDRLIGSVRELEGAVTRLQALKELDSEGSESDSREIGMILVDRLFRAESTAPRKPVRVDRIVDSVASRFGVETSDIRGSSRRRAVVDARSVAAYLGRDLTSMSYPELARAMGRRNHSTIKAAVDRVTKSVNQNARLRVRPDEEEMSVRYLIDTLRHALTHEGRSA